MPWDLDNPEIPVNKPKEIRELEAMGQKNLESMPPREMDEKVEDAALAVARSYKKLPDADVEGCVAVVSVALNVTGSALGGKFGAHMLSYSETEAEHICRFIFEEEED
jgi:hypothetical protein